MAVVINKLDLVAWSEDVFDAIRRDFNAFVARLGFVDIHFFPICALGGDNVVDPSANTPWYDGATLLHHLEHVNIAGDRNLIDMRLPSSTSCGRTPTSAATRAPWRRASSGPATRW